jgi:hypothetical protein
MTDPTCTRPGTVALDDLIAYLDDSASPTVREHVRTCAFCAAEARAYARAQGRLQKALHRFQCPSPQLLGEYQLDFVSPDERQQIAAHILDCPRCTDELRTLRVFLSGDVIDQPSPRAGLIQRVVAALAPPTASPALAGLRGSTDDVAQIYRAGDLTITIAWQSSSRLGHATLVGLLMNEAEDGAISDCTIRIISEHGATLVERTDAVGNFLFDELPRASYRLEVDLADQIVEIQDLGWGR